MDEIEDGAAEKEKRTGESVDTVQRDSIKKTPPGWLQPVLIGIGTATLSAILVVIISYIGAVTNAKLAHDFRSAEVQEDRQYRKIEVERQREIDKTTSNIKTMSECAKEFHVLHGIILMAGGTVNYLGATGAFTKDENFTSVTYRTMQVDQAARRLKQISVVQPLISYFPPESKVGILFSQYLVISQQYLQEVDNLVSVHPETLTC